MRSKKTSGTVRGEAGSKKVKSGKMRIKKPWNLKKRDRRRRIVGEDEMLTLARLNTQSDG